MEERRGSPNFEGYMFVCFRGCRISLYKQEGLRRWVTGHARLYLEVVGALLFER